MNAQEMNIAIHEWRGFRRHTSTTDPFKCDVCGLRFSSSIWAHWELPKFWCGDPDLKGTPNYAEDLNAMFEAEVMLKDYKNGGFYMRYLHLLGNSCEPEILAIHTPAVIRAKALLKTLNLWKETEASK